jgi:hypothetical protein
MHGMTHLKIVYAQQAQIIQNYKNAKPKLLKTKTAILFNKTCETKELRPRYIHIKINCKKHQRSNNFMILLYQTDCIFGGNKGVYCVTSKKTKQLMFFKEA